MRYGTGARILIGAAALVLAADVGAGLATAAASAPASTLQLLFAETRPASHTALSLHIVYRRAGDPPAKPSPIRHLEIAAPEGTTFDLHAVPACHATDQQIQAVGRSACPASSRVGQGTLTVMEGFGPPIDPQTTDAVIFNDGSGVLETFTLHGTPGPVIALDRIAISGGRLIGNPPQEPGGPPDGQTAVREINFHFPSGTGFVVTPPTCPANGAWLTTAAFRFADGTTQTATSTSPCTPPAAAAPGPASSSPTATPAASPSASTSVADRPRDLPQTGGRTSLAAAVGTLALALAVVSRRVLGGRRRLVL